MDDRQLTAVTTFPNRSSAEVARGVLESEGIEARLTADDAGGLHPELALNQGVRLVVRSHEVDEARAVLGLEDSTSGHDGERHRLRTRLFAAAAAVLIAGIVIWSVIQTV